MKSKTTQPTMDKPKKKRSWLNLFGAVDDKSLHIFLAVLFAFMACFTLLLGSIFPHIDGFMLWLTGVKVEAPHLKIKDISLDHSEKLIGASMILFVLSFTNSIISAADKVLQAWKKFMSRNPPPVHVTIQDKVIDAYIDKKLKDYVKRSDMRHKK